MMDDATDDEGSGDRMGTMKEDEGGPGDTMRDDEGR